MSTVAAAQTDLDQFIEKVKSFLDMRKWPSVRLAKAAGISQATISQFLSNQYPGDVETIKSKIIGVMNREAEKDTLRKSKNAFIETSISKRYFDIAKACHLYNEIGVCYSAAGLGKTISGREYAARNPDVIMIEADPGYTLKFFMQKLSSKLGMTNTKRHVPYLQDEIVEKLIGSGRFIIIDEAEQLSYRTLETIRRINDKAGVGILLTGMHKLLNNLRGIKDQYAQLFSRIGMAAKLEPLTEKDTRLILTSTLNIDSDLWQIFHNESSGITRRLYKIIARAQMISQMNEIEIDEEVIQEAANLCKIEKMN
jgi:DNA transposition AAA+ family ATPase